MSTRKKSKSKVTVTKAARRTPKRLSHTLYSYVTPVNGEYARGYGKKKFGSFSAYVDNLIAIDRKEGFTKDIETEKKAA